MTGSERAQWGHQSSVVDVRRLGAVGDGVADDTEAIQRAIDHGGITYLPPGDYSCRTLTMRVASHVVGANSGTYRYEGGAYVRAYPPSSVSRLVLREGTNAPLLLGPVGATRVILEDVELDGNNVQQTAGVAPVVLVEDSAEPEDTQWVLTRCYLHGRSDPQLSHWGHGASNLYIGAGRQACHVTDTVSNFAHRHGLEINGSDTLVHGCIAGDNGAHGIVLGAWASTVSGTSVYNNLDGIHVPDTGPLSPKRIILSGNGIDRNRRHGVHVAGTPSTGASGVSIMGNGFTSNSCDEDGVGAHVAVHTNSGTVVVGGNVFSSLEPGYRHRTSAAIHVENGPVVDMGNAYEGGSVSGLTNAPHLLVVRPRA